MKRLWIFSTLCIVALVTGILIFASDSNPFNSGDMVEKNDDTSIASQDVTPIDDTITASTAGTLDNNNDFACNLFRTIYEREGRGKSTIVSPISVGFLLGMLHDGADGETRRQINHVLGLGWSVKEINEYFKKIMDQAPNVDPTVTVKTANSIFVVSGNSLVPQYKTDMQNYYNALADAVDYNGASIVEKINNWCKKKTDGMIPELLKEGELNTNRVMYLLNAVYFKASWTEKFNPNETRDRHFTKLDGTTVKLPMMHLKTKAVYGKNDLCKMLRLHYGNGGYSMVVMLPNEGKAIGDIIKSLSAKSMEMQLQQMRSTEVDILLPRFTTVSETYLEKALSSMGMPRAFGNLAEFPNMVQDHSDDLYVSMMKQKAKIEVNEEGTKAAAVTVVEMSEKSAMPSHREYVEFHATRPFVYFIIENSTGTIYFMGTYCGEEGKQVEIQGRNDNSSNEIYSSVEQMPQFPGGEAALMKYLQENVKYPPKAAKDSIQGRVVVKFVVDSLGYVGVVRVVRSVSKDLDAEAVRVVKTLPRFAPGRMFGKAVNVWYTLPVTFKLQDILEQEKPKDVEVRAEFPGGKEALNQFLENNIKYPPKAAKKRIQGRVEVAFWIDRSGKVHDVRVVESVDKDLDKEAVRVCKLLPDFIPATVNGEPVEVIFKLPIRFKIPGLKTQYLNSVQIDMK